MGRQENSRIRSRNGENGAFSFAKDRALQTGWANEIKQVSKNNGLIKLFGSTSRARILSLLFSRLHQPLYQREIVHETGLSLQTVQRELENLVGLGILRRQDVSQRVYYQISSHSALFGPLKQIFQSAG